MKLLNWLKNFWTKLRQKPQPAPTTIEQIIEQIAQTIELGDPHQPEEPTPDPTKDYINISRIHHELLTKASDTCVTALTQECTYTNQTIRDTNPILIVVPTGVTILTNKECQTRLTARLHRLIQQEKPTN